MTITRDDLKMLDGIDNLLTTDETWLVYDTLSNLSKNPYNIKCAGDDRAARLEAALIRFLVESKK